MLQTWTQRLKYMTGPAPGPTGGAWPGQTWETGQKEEAPPLPFPDEAGVKLELVGPQGPLEKGQARPGNIQLE